MKTGMLSAVLAVGALAAGPLPYASATVIGWNMEALWTDGRLANALDSNPAVGRGGLNVHSGSVEQTTAKARFGSHSALISGDGQDTPAANVSISGVALSSTSTLTVMGHVFLNAADGTEDERVLLSNQNSTNEAIDGAGEYRLAVNPGSGKFYFDFYDGSATNLATGIPRGQFDHIESASGAVATGTWEHLAMTFNGGFLTLYVNGKQVASADYSATVSALGNAQTTLVGNTIRGVPVLDGYLDDFYYNDTAALSAAQVAYYSSHTITSPVPEPASLGAVALGGLLLMRRRDA